MKLETLIEQNYHKLSENELHIWDYIQRNPTSCRELSIDQLAQACNISHTTILRFARKLGLKGFSELKVILKWQELPNDGFQPDEIERTIQDYRQNMEYISSVNLTDLFTLLDRANKIYIFGSGNAQQLAAHDLKQKFFMANKLMHVVAGKEEMFRLVELLGENDVVILISLSGDNVFVNQMAERIKDNKGVVVSICRIQSNRLIYLSDINIPFFTHCAKTGAGVEYWPTNMLFQVNEFLALRYLQYQDTKRRSDGP